MHWGLCEADGYWRSSPSSCIRPIAFQGRLPWTAEPRLGVCCYTFQLFHWILANRLWSYCELCLSQGKIHTLAAFVIDKWSRISTPPGVYPFTQYDGFIRPTNSSLEWRKSTSDSCVAISMKVITYFHLPEVGGLIGPIRSQWIKSNGTVVLCALIELGVIRLLLNLRHASQEWVLVLGVEGRRCQSLNRSGLDHERGAVGPKVSCESWTEARDLGGTLTSVWRSARRLTSSQLRTVLFQCFVRHRWHICSQFRLSLFSFN